ncbi:hypothetical protein, partial [Rhodobaculum claviforme]
MLGALPGVTAQRLARRIDAVAGPDGMGAFAAPCRVAAEAGSLASEPSAGLALALAEVRFADSLGRRDPGETGEARFTADATLELTGPLAVTPATGMPGGVGADGRDLMLALTLDALVAEGEGAGPPDRADWLA